MKVSTPSIKVNSVSKTYEGNSNVIPAISFAINNGEFIVILGPSGCGKSTLLRMIAGLEAVSAGEIFIDGMAVQGMAPKDRGCAMVFQNYALYPHMTVAQNIGYSLKIQGASKKSIAEKVEKIASSMGLNAFLTRLPHQLSGGQRQRVAIGRAIIREPKVLLFDEPLSNLDAQLRNDMRLELTELHRRIDATSIFVTHDQIEAMTLADRILLLNRGHIEQFATPQEIYHHPNSIFVATFIGSPTMNIIDVDVRDGDVLVKDTDKHICTLGRGSNGQYRLGIRPEDITLSTDSGVKIKLTHKEDLGSHFILHGEIAQGVNIKLVTPFGQQLPEIDTYYINVSAEKCHYFDNEQGLRVEL